MTIKRNIKSLAELESLFWPRVSKTGVDGCWIWWGTVQNRGYGKMGYKKKEYLAHRLAWEFTHGPIPTGLVVLHKCDTPRCVNPNHLQLGTQLDNIKDRDSNGRVAHGETHCRAKLSDADIQSIRDKVESGVSRLTVRIEYGISQPYLSRLIRGLRR